MFAAVGERGLVGRDASRCAVKVVDGDAAARRGQCPPGLDERIDDPGRVPRDRAGANRPGRSTDSPGVELAQHFAVGDRRDLRGQRRPELYERTDGGLT